MEYWSGGIRCRMSEGYLESRRGSWRLLTDERAYFSETFFGSLPLPATRT